MKKVSTVAAKQRKKFSEPTLTIGDYTHLPPKVRMGRLLFTACSGATIAAEN